MHNIRIIIISIVHIIIRCCLVAINLHHVIHLVFSSFFSAKSDHFINQNLNALLFFIVFSSLSILCVGFHCVPLFYTCVAISFVYFFLPSIHFVSLQLSRFVCFTILFFKLIEIKRFRYWNLTPHKIEIESCNQDWSDGTKHIIDLDFFPFAFPLCISFHFGFSI